MSAPTVQRTACNRDCPDACEILATIEDGRVTRLRGAPDHPVTQGFLCHRTSRFLERQYSPDRLTQPLRRVGDTWQEISWETALDEIAETMLRIRTESGGAALLHYRCGGSLGIMKHVSDWFFQRFGPVTVKSGDVCSGAGEAAQVADFGISDSNDLFDLRNSRTIVLWGKNVFVSSVHLLPLLREARRRGTRLVLIDPVYHRTAQLCDLVIQPRPGGDAALACGVARWLLDHQRHDAGVAEYCDHWPVYRELISSRSLVEWAAAAEVDPSQLVQLAQHYAAGPAAILIGWGLQRRQHGAATVRAIDALATISGNIGVSGGGASFYFRRRGAFDFSFAQSATPARTIPEPLLGPGILQAHDPPIRLAWVTAANPVTMLPDSTTVARALAGRELTVVVDSFMTDTARCAHLVLPTTTFLEEDDLVGAYGHHWLAELRPVTRPPAGVLSDYQIVQRLAARVGLGDEFGEDVESWKDRLLQRVSPLGVTRDRLREGAVRNPLAPQVLFADRRFMTPSGKVNLLTHLPADCLQPRLVPSLRLAALSTDQAQSSQWSADQQIGPATATVHPDTVPSATDGQLAELRSSQGSLTVRLKLDRRQRPDLVLMDKGGWLEAGRCANALIAAELTDAGQGAVYYDTPVELRLLR